MSFLFILLFVVLPLALIAFAGKAPRTGANLSRAGLMELQNLLEPERRVEIVREIENKEELLVRLDDEGGAEGSREKRDTPLFSDKLLGSRLSEK